MTARAPRVRYATKAAVARLKERVREIGFDIDKCAIDFLPDGGVRFTPVAVTPTGEVDTWGDV